MSFEVAIVDATIRAERAYREDFKVHRGESSSHQLDGTVIATTEASERQTAARLNDGKVAITMRGIVAVATDAGVVTKMVGSSCGSLGWGEEYLNGMPLRISIMAAHGSSYCRSRARSLTIGQ